MASAPSGSQIPEGESFEDNVENGVVLFLSDLPVESPMTIELFDSNDLLVASDG